MRLLFAFSFFWLSLFPLIAQPGSWSSYSRPGAVNDYLDEPDTLWLATDAGLFIIDKNNLNVSQLDKVDAGLPSLKVESIARHPQTRDLFIGTYDMALAVRDGDDWRPVAYPPAILDSPQPVLTYCIEFDAEGRLWAGTNQGILSYGGDEDWGIYNPSTGYNDIFAAWDMERTPEGDLFIASHWPWRAGQDTLVQLFPEGFAETHFIFAYGNAKIHQQANGEIWFFTDINRAAHYEDGSWEPYDFSDPDGPSFFSLSFLTESPDGRFWAYDEQAGFQVYADGVWQSIDTPLLNWPDSQPLALIFSGDQTFALGSQASVVETGGVQLGLQLGNYPFEGYLTQFTYDFDGNLWALDQNLFIRNLESGAALSVSPAGESLFVYQYTVDTHGRAWANTNEGLWHQTATGWERFGPGNSPLPEIIGPVRMGMDAGGNLWMTIFQDALYRYDGAEWKRFNHPAWSQNFIYSLAGGVGGEVWANLYNQDEGVRLARFTGEKLEFFDTQGTGLGTFGHLFYDQIANRAWVTGEPGTLAYFDGQDWQQIELPSSPQGYGWLNTVAARGEVILAAGREQAYWYDGGEWTVFDPANSPLAGYMLTGAALDKKGSAWFSHSGLEAVDLYETGVTTATNQFLPTAKLRLQCAPNPAQEITWLTWEFPSPPEAVTLHLLSGTGQAVRSFRLPPAPGPQRMPLSLAGLPTGPYWLRLQSGAQQAVVKIIKMKQ